MEKLRIITDFAVSWLLLYQLRVKDNITIAREDLQMVSAATTDFKHAIASKVTDDILDT